MPALIALQRGSAGAAAVLTHSETEIDRSIIRPQGGRPLGFTVAHGSDHRHAGGFRLVGASGRQGSLQCSPSRCHARHHAHHRQTSGGNGRHNGSRDPAGRYKAGENQARQTVGRVPGLEQGGSFEQAGRRRSHRGNRSGRRREGFSGSVRKLVHQARRRIGRRTGREARSQIGRCRIGRHSSDRHAKPGCSGANVGRDRGTCRYQHRSRFADTGTTAFRDAGRAAGTRLRDDGRTRGQTRGGQRGAGQARPGGRENREPRQCPRIERGRARPDADQVRHGTRGRFQRSRGRPLRRRHEPALWHEDPW